jgi:hypothetical protein
MSRAGPWVWCIFLALSIRGYLPSHRPGRASMVCPWSTITRAVQLLYTIQVRLWKAWGFDELVGKALHCTEHAHLVVIDKTPWFPGLESTAIQLVVVAGIEVILDGSIRLKASMIFARLINNTALAIPNVTMGVRNHWPLRPTYER